MTVSSHIFIILFIQRAQKFEKENRKKIKIKGGGGAVHQCVVFNGLSAVFCQSGGGTWTILVMEFDLFN